ncbi:diguanylate cyclase [Rheinheimera sp. 4Y26]|uniref:tetratricopeptide repeat-containing diguanylate cyclase n=1 Tax=Rheinheimera sp. 4Y26 TaxID=2977811 RepID=UPI0021B14C30|nr:diguanylate cyclase [Rheinheimera sp. 4Y26]MCT6698610.1 diguanylate cyclase [Rheinheimera sp. 4Y26]
MTIKLSIKHSTITMLQLVLCSSLLLSNQIAAQTSAQKSLNQTGQPIVTGIAAELEQALAAAEQLYQTNTAQSKQEFARLLSQYPQQHNVIQQRFCWLLAPAEPEAAVTLRNNLSAELPELWQLRFSLCAAYATEQLGNNQAALELYQELLLHPKAGEDPTLQARALTLRGEQYAALGSYPAALEDLKQAYQLEQQLGNAKNLSYVSNALANLYADPALADYNEAIAMYQQTLAYHRKEQNRQDEATALYNLGSTYESKGELGTALDYLQQALKVEEQRAQPDDIAFTKWAIAKVLSKAGKAQQAVELLNNTILYYQQSGNQEYLAYTQLSRAISYMALLQWPAAEQDLTAAAAYFQQHPNPRFEARLYKEYAAVAAAQQQWQQAFVRQQQQLEREHYLQQQLLDKRTSALKTQLQTEQLKSEKELLAQKNQQQQQQLLDANSIKRWQLTALLFAALLILSLLLLMQRQYKLSRQLRDLALMDELTRLPNRRHTVAMAEQLWQQHQQQQQPLAVLALDIDFFKKINDSFGHQAGDQVLKKVGHCLRTGLRPQDKVGRVGGEEFLCLLPNTNEQQALEIAQRLCQQVAQLNVSDIAEQLQVTVSIGIACLGTQGDLLQLWHQADTALYQAKQQGRNQAVLAG